jgi:hypothetical protein
MRISVNCILVTDFAVFNYLFCRHVTHNYLKLNNIDYKRILLILLQLSAIMPTSIIHLLNTLNYKKSLTIINNMVNQMTNKNSSKRGVLATLAALAALFTAASSRLSLLSPISLQSKFLSN